MRTALLVTLLILSPIASAEWEVVITLDDLPINAGPTIDPASHAELTAELLRALTRHEVPAIGLVNEGKLYQDEVLVDERVALLEAWLDAGMELGNHGYAHLDLHRVSPSAFAADVEKGEIVIRRLLARRGHSLSFFRHPFLHTGRDRTQRLQFEQELADRGIRVAPVTIDNAEWIYARAYENALATGDANTVERVGQSYLDYMMDMFTYYEGQSRELFEREIPQILLLHANRLNADWLDRLLTRIVGRDYRFIPLAQALEDPAYDSQDEYIGPGGITWLHRWALTRQVDPALFRGEPRCPSFIQDLAGIQE